MLHLVLNPAGLAILLAGILISARIYIYLLNVKRVPKGLSPVLGPIGLPLIGNSLCSSAEEFSKVERRLRRVVSDPTGMEQLGIPQ